MLGPFNTRADLTLRLPAFALTAACPAQHEDEKTFDCMVWVRNVAKAARECVKKDVKRTPN